MVNEVDGTGKVEFLISSLTDYEGRARWVSVPWRLDQASLRINEFRERLPGAVADWDGEHPQVRAPWAAPGDFTTAGNTLTSWAYHDNHSGHLTMLASEAVHHLRTALDYLAYQLVLADTGVAHPARTQFPLADTVEAFTQEARRRLPGVSESVLALVESVQPYSGAAWTSYLRQLSNRDKHRYPIDVAPFYSFTVDPSIVYLDPLGDPDYRGFQVENAALSFRFVGTSGDDGAALEVLPTLNSILAGLADLTGTLVESLSITEISINRIEC